MRMAKRLPRFLGSYAELDRRVWILAVARGINTMGFSIVMPFMAMHIVEDRGGTGATYGGIYLVSGLAAALGNGLSGEASDRVGRRRIMLAALLVRAANMVALGLAVLAQAPLGVLGALVVLNGLLRAFFDPAASAAVTELVPPERRVAAYGLQRIGINLGWALGPALGGVLAAAHSYGGLFFVAAAGTLVAAVAVSRVHDLGAARPGAEGRLSLATVRQAYAKNPGFFNYLGLVFAGSILTTQIYSTLSVYCRTELLLGKAAIGLLYMVNGALVVILQVPAVSYIDRGGPARALVLGPMIYTVSYVAIGASGGFAPLAAAMALLTAGEVIFAPALSDMAAHLGDPRRLGRAFGLFGLMQQLGVSLGPFVGGLLYDHARRPHLLMWGLIAGAMGLCGVGYAAFARAHRLSW
jgi:predicted MFS family arabinose efflux permease